MDPLSIVRRRLVDQRLAGEPFEEAADAVRWLGAVQAQEFAEAKWSLAERTRRSTDLEVEAAFSRGEIIRTHLLRPTWHLVAPEDLRWLLRITRPRVHALNSYWYRKAELTPDVLTRGHDALASSLDGGETRTRRELERSLARAGISADGVRLAYLLMHAELEELICSGPRRGKQQTYALLDSRVPPSTLDDMPRDRALRELVLRYFRSHGPATIRDFTAWSSLTVADTRAALEDLGDALRSETDDSGTRWYAAPSRVQELPRRARGAFLVPMFDETIVAYQDLRVALAYPPPRPGILDRAIVIDGRTHGSWSRVLNGRTVTVAATLFGPLASQQTRLFTDAVERFGRFLGAEASVEFALAT